MLHIGCHLSSFKGYRHMGEDALSIKADTFQFFTRNPRGSKAKKADPKDAEALREIAGKYREEKVGLASLLSMVADDVADCAAMLDDTEGKREDGGVIG